MSFFDTAWTITTMVSRRSYEEISVIVDDRVPYPIIDYVGRPVKEYVLHVPLPEKIVPYELREDKIVMWRTFRACVAHEAGHAYLTNPTIYEGWRSEKDGKIAPFVINLLEDYRVEVFLSSKWAGLGRDLALANAVAYLRSYPVDKFDDKLKRVMAAVVSEVFVGCVKGNLSKEEKGMVDYIYKVLKEVKWASQPDLLVSAAEKIYKKLIRCGSSDKILNYPLTPHHDGRSSSEYFSRSVLGFKDDAREMVERTLSDTLKMKEVKKVFSEDAVSEADYVFYSEEIFGEKKKRTLGFYRKNRFNFVGIGFPKGNYAEYLRAKRKVYPIVKRISRHLDNVKPEYEEVPLQRSGLVDTLEAMQAVGSGSQRTDVFRQWDKDMSSSAWAVLIDDSQSLSSFTWELKHASICLAEVASSLMDPASWALYTFSDTFSIVKDFDERYDRGVQCRLGGLVTGGPTFLPDALRVVTPKLFTRPQNYKALIVVTDGQPHGYEGIMDESKNAIREVTRSGITLIAIGLGTEKVKDLFRNWCSVKTLEDLAKSFTRLYFSLSMW